MEDASLRKLLAHHDALRMRVRNGKGFFVETDGNASFSYFDFSDNTDTAARVQDEAEALQLGLHLENGSVIRFARLHTDGDAPDRLFIVAHHLVIDGVS